MDTQDIIGSAILLMNVRPEMKLYEAIEQIYLAIDKIENDTEECCDCEDCDDSCMEDKEDAIEQKYPCIKEDCDGTKVLFIEENMGYVIESNEFETCYYSDDWEESEFELVD